MGVENQTTSTAPVSNSLVVGELDLEKIKAKKQQQQQAKTNEKKQEEEKKFLVSPDPEAEIEEKEKDQDKELKEKWISYPMKEMVRDICWIDEGKALVALDKKLGVILLDENGLKKIVMFPDFHKDIIRQVSVNPFSPYFIISGGFDCSAFITGLLEFFKNHLIILIFSFEKKINV